MYRRLKRRLQAPVAGAFLPAFFFGASTALVQIKRTYTVQSLCSQNRFLFLSCPARRNFWFGRWSKRCHRRRRIGRDTEKGTYRVFKNYLHLCAHCSWIMFSNLCARSACVQVCNPRLECEISAFTLFRGRSRCSYLFFILCPPEVFTCFHVAVRSHHVEAAVVVASFLNLASSHPLPWWPVWKLRCSLLLQSKG